MLRPLAGRRLNGEVVQPAAAKIGPRMNGRQRTVTPALAATSSTRMAAG